MEELAPKNHKDDLEKLIEDINEGTTQFNKENNEAMEEINEKDIEHHNDFMELNDGINEQDEVIKQEDEIIEHNDETLHPEMNVLNLPPRREVHSQNNQKIHFKISKPFLRFVFVIILLVIVLGITFYINPDLIGF